MEFNFRPQWSVWKYRVQQSPLCGKCGLVYHRFHMCPAQAQKCFSCEKFGHFARQCYSQKQPNVSTGSSSVRIKSRRQQQRDKQRMTSYYERKNTLRELPFSNVRNSVLIKFFDNSTAVKVELKTVYKNLKTCETNSSKISNQLRKVEEENRILIGKLNELQSKAESEQLNIVTKRLKEYEDKIGELVEKKEKLEAINTALLSLNNSKSSEIQRLHSENQELRNSGNFMLSQRDILSNLTEICKSHLTTPNLNYTNNSTNRSFNTFRGRRR